MEISEDYLQANDFRMVCGHYTKNGAAKCNVQVRRTVGDNSWQVSVFKPSTKEFGKYEDLPSADSDSLWVMGCITTVEELEAAMKLIGFKDKTNWREKMPFSVKRTKRTFKVMQHINGKDTFTGYETNDYNAAMAEMKRLNIENNKL